MDIRDATREDGDELQRLQATCPQGTALVATVVNTPDFFGRAAVYEDHRTFVATENGRIIGSAACAVRPGLVGGEPATVGYEFQYFTALDHRRKGVAKELHRRVGDHLRDRGACLSYAIIMAGNTPSMRLFEGFGFSRHRTLSMPGLAVRKKMPVDDAAHVRRAEEDDYGVIAGLMNEAWGGHELYQPASADSVARFVERTPGFDCDCMFVLERDGRVAACLGFWDWGAVMRVTVKAVNLKMRLMGLFLTLTRILPSFVKAGDTLRQVMLTPVAFTDPVDLSVLVRHVNNLVFDRDVQQIFAVCEPGGDVSEGLGGFIRVDTRMHVYVSHYDTGPQLSRGPVFVDGIDL